MRFDKLTTKFQQALADAQSLALGNDQQFIEPQHLLMAMLEQDEGGPLSLLQRAGVNVPPLKSALAKSLERLPKVEGHGGEVQVGRDLTNLLNLTDKEAQSPSALAPARPAAGPAQHHRLFVAHADFGLWADRVECADPDRAVRALD